MHQIRIVGVDFEKNGCAVDDDRPEIVFPVRIVALVELPESDDGFEGTVLGTLVMPYCSGIGNLLFAFLLGRGHTPGAGAAVVENCFVNNVTNLAYSTSIISTPGLNLRFFNPPRTAGVRFRVDW